MGEEIRRTSTNSTTSVFFTVDAGGHKLRLNCNATAVGNVIHRKTEVVLRVCLAQLLQLQLWLC
jgi:hypothetical protein